MKILVTGGAGFIASHISDAYIKQGHQVVIVDDLSRGKKENIPAQAKFYKENITSANLESIFKKEQPEIVNHHAAQIDVRISTKNPAADAQINILGSLNVIQNAHKHHVKKIIFASTGGAIYGNQNIYPADKSHPTEPQSPYGIAKLSVEKYLQFYNWTYNLPFVALRYSNVYGPRQDSHGEAGVIAIFTEKLLKKESPIIFGNGEQTRDYVYVGDVVSCNVEALKDSSQGIYHVATGVETSVNQIAQNLIKATGCSNVPVKHEPEKPGDIPRSCLKPGELQQMPPVTLNEGLQKTVDWFKKI